MAKIWAGILVADGNEQQLKGGDGNCQFCGADLDVEYEVGICSVCLGNSIDNDELLVREENYEYHVETFNELMNELNWIADGHDNRNKKDILLNDRSEAKRVYEALLNVTPDADQFDYEDGSAVIGFTVNHMTMQTAIRLTSLEPDGHEKWDDDAVPMGREAEGYFAAKEEEVADKYTEFMKETGEW